MSEIKGKDEGLKKAADVAKTIRVLGGFIALILVTLLWYAARLVEAEGKWSNAGTFGDTLGGISNFITMLVVCASAVYATREVRRARQQHVDEVRGDAARLIWRGAFGLGRDLRDLLNVVGQPAARKQSVQPSIDRVEQSFLQFRDVLADAQLFFGPLVIDPVAAVGEMRLPILKLAENPGMNTDLSVVEEATQSLLTRMAVAQKVLRPFATLEASEFPEK